MILQNNLYSISGKEKTADGFSYALQLNPECFIYKAHFPQQPITPGVCITQIAVELASDMAGCVLRIVGIKNVKFLSVISPDDITSVTYDVKVDEEDETGNIRVKAEAKSADVVYAKMSLICKK